MAYDINLLLLAAFSYMGIVVIWRLLWVPPGEPRRTRSATSAQRKTPGPALLGSVRRTTMPKQGCATGRASVPSGPGPGGHRASVRQLRHDSLNRH